MSGEKFKIDFNFNSDENLSYRNFFIKKNNKIIKEFLSGDLIIDWLNCLNYILTNKINNIEINSDLRTYISSYAGYEFRYVKDKNFTHNPKGSYGVISKSDFKDYNDLNNYYITKTRRMKLEEVYD